MNVNEIIWNTISLEGGFTDNPKDAGNWTGGKQGEGELKGTKYGISAKTYPSIDIKNLTPDQAVAIYKKDFWDASNLSLLANEKVAQKVFDIGVNMGQSVPIRFLQQITGVKEDGILGKDTAFAVNTRSPEYIVEELARRQLLRYADIIIRDPSQIVFLKGWINRAFA